MARALSRSTRRRRTLGRIARTSLTVLGTTLFFVTATAAGIVLHLNHPAARRLVSKTVTEALSPVVTGTITLDRVARIALLSGSVDGMDVTIRDAEGHTVIVAHSVSARIALRPLLRSLVDNGPLVVHLDRVHVAAADVTLRDDASGVNSLANTFLPRDAGLPAAPPGQTSPGKGVVLTIDDVTITHSWAHGTIGAQPMDIDADGLSGRFRVDPTELSGTVRQLAIHARWLPIPAGAADGSVEGRITYPFAEARRTTGRAAIEVRVGALTATARAILHGQSIQARAEVPSTPAHDLAAVVTGVPFTAPVGATIDAMGTWNAARVSGRVDLGAGHVDFAGGVKHGSGVAVVLTTKVVGLSLTDTLPAMPAGLVDAEVDARAIIAPGGVTHAAYEAHTAPTTIDGQSIPSIATHGTLDGHRLAGEATIDEPGAPTTAAYVLGPEKHRPESLGLDGDVRIVIPDLRQAPRLGGSVGGAARARVRGHLTLDDELALEAVVTASGAGLHAGPVRVSSARVEATVRGTVRSPTVHATVRAGGVRAAGVSVSRATVNVDGAILAPRVRVAAETREGDTLVASANVVVGPTTTVRGLEASLVRNEEQVRVQVRSVQVRATGTALDDVRVQAAGGSLQASLSTGHGTVQAKVASTPFDLSRLRVLIGPSAPVLTGTATLDVDLEATPRGARGFVRLAARNVAPLAGLHSAQIDGEAVFDGRAVALRAIASVPEFGTVVVTSEGARLGGSMLEAASYRSATGGLNAMAVADLSRVAALLPEGTLPLDRIAGQVIVTLRGSRRPEQLPDVSVGVTTEGLELAMKTVDGIAGFSLRGVELALSGRHDARSGWVTLDAFATDAHGELAEIHAGAKPSLGALSSPPDSLREQLLRTPFELVASVPRRNLDRVPDALRWGKLRGNVAVELSASGTARNPQASVSVRAKGMSLDEQGPRQEPFDVHLDAAFADGRGSSTAEIASAGRALLVARGDGTLQVADLIDGREGGPRWNAGGDLALSALPLRPLRLLAGQPIGGCVSGTVALRGLHDDAMIDADVHADGLRVGRVLFRAAKVTARAGAGRATLDARFVQEDGELTARGSVGIDWGAALTPSMDDSREAHGRIHAKAFRLATLRPFVRDFLGRVDGILDGDLRYTGLPSDHSSANVEGEASVREGVIDAPLLGQELRAIQGKVTLSSDGEVRLRDASAEGISGRIVVDATAHLARFSFRDARATVRIARREALSLTYQGVELGNAWGDVNVTAASRANGVIAVDVVVPRFELELPHAAARSTQKLDDEPTIQIGGNSARGFVSLRQEAQPKPTESTPPRGQNTPPTGGVVVRVALGREVRVHSTNRIDAWLSGTVQAVAQGDRTAVSGAVQVDRGFLDIQGRRFTIEHATASFDPTRPPGDPTITATAVYDAPDATRIFAAFTGTAETGKLRLYSDPALSQPEILSLIVFGTREGADSSGGGSAAEAAGAAASVGGGVATQGLNKALAEFTPVEITTRVDTSDSQDPRPEVAVAISRKVSATVWYRIGLPMPGQNPDRSMLRLDYRFQPRWLLETSVGDKGTSIVDLIWKMRY